MGIRATRVLLAAGGAAALLVLASVGGAEGHGAAGCTSLAGPAACAVSASAPFVTPDQARAATIALWNARERALDTHNVAAFKKLDTGSVRLEDIYAVDSALCGCSTYYWHSPARTARHVTTFLPRQSHYPLYFLADVLAVRPGGSAPSSRATAELVITRDSPSQPWRIDMQMFDIGYGAPVPRLPDPVKDSAGYNTQSAAASSARSWPGLLTAYYNSLKNTGAPPPGSRFAAGPHTTGTDLTQRRQGSITLGVRHHYRFVMAGGPWLVHAGGLQLACGDILELATNTPAHPGYAFYTLAHAHPSWGPDLATGYYSKIVTTWNWTVCIYAQSNKLQVVAPTNGDYPIQDVGTRTAPVPNNRVILP